MALWDVENSTCPRCGNKISECHGDPDRDWYPQRIVCNAEMEALAAAALYAQLHDEQPYHDGTWQSWSKERSFAFPYRYDEGVDIRATPVDVNPDDHFTTNVNAVPIRPGTPELEVGAELAGQ